MRALYFAFVSLSWAVAPIVKRRVVDYMSLGEEEDGPSPVRTFVAMFSVLSSVFLVMLAYPASNQEFMRRLPAVGWTLMGMGVVLGCLASLALVVLLQKGNPGLTMVHLNAITSVSSYVMGALLYGNISWEGLAGVLLIAAGFTLTSP